MLVIKKDLIVEFNIIYSNHVLDKNILKQIGIESNNEE